MARTTSFRNVAKSNYSFARVPSVNVPRSQFNRSCGVKTTFDSAYLVPIFWDEALPGDTFALKLTGFVRMNTPLYPVMDNIFVDYFFFAVANRLVWANWPKFCGEREDPADHINYTVPRIVNNTLSYGDLEEYFGLPTGQGALDYNTLHLRAYNLIYREWFRDQNLIDSPVVRTTDSGDIADDFALLKRAKRHDYFTGCLPWPQKGDPVDLPLGSTAPVIGTGDEVPLFTINAVDGFALEGSGAGPGTTWDSTPTGNTTASWDETKLVANLAGASAASINDMREAFQIQKMLEKDARGGTRYTEVLRTHFGVISPDQRLQRPEYLGGGSARVNIHPVAATSEPSGSKYLGDLGGFGLSISDGIGFVKSFTEHCVIIGLVNVRADISYQQGVERMWSRQTRYDYYWPSLAHLGEQPVYNKEIYWSDVPATDDATFGYQERYGEYRYKQSRVTGKMRSNNPTSLDPWHLALDFASLPALNQTFIEDDPPIERVVAVDTEPEFMGDFWFDLKCARPMPTYSVPGLIDHF